MGRTKLLLPETLIGIYTDTEFAALPGWKRSRLSSGRKKWLPSTSARERWLKFMYKMTENDYDELLISQNGVCAICKESPKEKYLSVDHNHTTEKVRGLLCNRCNNLLGRALDDITILEAAIQYLKERD